MTLHHISHAEKTLANALYWLKDGGRLIIREHDCNTTVEHVYLDIIDRLWHHVFTDENDPTKFDKLPPYYYSYFRSLEWVIDILGKYDEVKDLHTHNFAYLLTMTK